MLPKFRKLSRRELSLVFRRGSTLKTDSLTVKYLPNTKNYSRFAVVVSTKVFSKAHDRNHIKRLIFHHLTFFTSKMDIVIILQPRVVNLTYEVVDSSLHQVLSKISLL